MEEREKKRLTSRELMAFFDSLFPNGFGGPDVLAELTPDGWERSSLMACFHPSAERRRQEREQFERALAEFRGMRRRPPERVGAAGRPEGASPEPEDEPVPGERPVDAAGELTELVGCCLWDVFSDNHEVIAADGRHVDIGSFRAASGFLDEYLSRDREGWFRGDYMRFYMGTAFIAGRADLTPVYRMIFRRLRHAGADWVYHFPQLFVVRLGDDDVESDEERLLRRDVQAGNAEAREVALDRQAPETVAAYRAEYGRDPQGWPPARGAPESCRR